MTRHRRRESAFTATFGAALAAPLLALGAFAATHTSEVDATPDEGPVTTKLAFRAVQDWDIILPAGRFEPVPVHGEIEVGPGFAAERSGVMSFMLDTNGDGKTDKKVKGTESFVKVRGKDDDGERFEYALRIVYQNERFEWASSGVLSGKIAGTTFRVIDQDNDGIYGEIGTDAMIVGKGRGASTLSRVVNVDGELVEIDFSEDGRELSYKPFRGESGTIDVMSKYGCRGKLIAAVFESRDGEVAFNAARSNKPIRVPAGEYRLVSGFAAKGDETVEMRGGKMRAIKVDARKEKVVDWGGPIVAEFGYQVHGDTITVPPSVNFYGGAGEEYTRFQPNAKSPKIIVLDSQTRKEVASGRFGGC